jgi:hypothetical protein
VTPSVWFYGIEHGDPAGARRQAAPGSRDYSIDEQLAYPFNLNAFKLLAAVHGQPAHCYEQFARLHQPWVRGARGYLKGNLYPYPCRRVDTWTPQAALDTGFAHKADFIDWCDTQRIEAIAEAARLHRPRLFIGVGATMAKVFSRAFFGEPVPLETYRFAVNGHGKMIRFACRGDARLVVLPHLSGGCNGLNSNEAIQIAGTFVARLLG